ncbi:ParB/RepB/Spo0J family partition protein [Zavarzinia sp. CC-PAN008]|uniref:ParB/RepB/Spo0J family partition protein n=1 Tax=Zavarzinia sp. CC-PAN008 TaxID=3243332 RepID=UPI003F745698
MSRPTAKMRAAAAALQAPIDLPAAPPPAAPAQAAHGVIAISYLNIRTSDYNPRKTFDLVTLTELAESINAHGLQQPLGVRPAIQDGVYILVMGERRYRAIGMLLDDGRWPVDRPVTCIVQHPAGIAGHIEAALVENAQREDVAPLEEGEAFLALHQTHGRTVAEIAASIGKTKRHVQLRMDLVSKLCDDAREGLRTGKLSLAHGRALCLAPQGEQKKLVKKILDKSPPTWAETGERLMQHIRFSLKPADHAPEGLRLDVVEDPDTGERYVHGDQLKAANKARAEAIRDDWRAQGKTAEIVDYFSEFNFERCPPDEAIVLHLDYFGSLTEHVGFRRKPQAQPDPEREARLKAEAERRHQDGAAFSAAMRLALAEHPQLAARALLGAVVQARGPADCFVLPQATWNVGSVLRAYHDQCAAALPIAADAALQVMASIAAASFHVQYLHDPNRRYLTALADAMGVEVPAFIRLDASTPDAPDEADDDDPTDDQEEGDAA